MGRPCTHESLDRKSTKGLEIWWFKLQGLSEETMCEPDMNRGRAKRPPRTHHGRARRTLGAHRRRARQAPNAHHVHTRWKLRSHQAYVVQMKAEGYSWNLIYIYLIFHYVSSRNYENGSYCSLKWEGRWLKEGAPRKSIDRTKGAPLHGLGRD